MSQLVTRNENRPKWGLFGDDFDNMFEGFFRPMATAAEDGARSFVPAVDVTEEDDRYVVKADLPGVKKEDIDITVNDDILTINASTKFEEEEKDKKGRLIRSERRYGDYVRSMRLSGVVQDEKIKAVYKDGVLTLNLPKAEEAKPKKIEVKVS